MGFIFWLGQALERAGYGAAPAPNTEAGNELIQKYKLAVDILVIDPTLPDAFVFISRLRRSRPALNVVAAVPENWKEPPSMAEVDAVMRKPIRLTKSAMIPWIDLIQNLPSGSSTGPYKSKPLQNC